MLKRMAPRVTGYARHVLLILSSDCASSAVSWPPFLSICCAALIRPVCVQWIPHSSDQWKMVEKGAKPQDVKPSMVMCMCRSISLRAFCSTAWRRLVSTSSTCPSTTLSAPSCRSAPGPSLPADYAHLVWQCHHMRGLPLPAAPWLAMTHSRLIMCNVQAPSVTGNAEATLKGHGLDSGKSWQAAAADVPEEMTVCLCAHPRARLDLTGFQPCALRRCQR